MTRPFKALVELVADRGISGLISSAYHKALLSPYCYLRNGEFRGGTKQIWVHIGAHKTGSTTIQSAFKRNINQLRQQSIFHDSRGYMLSRRLKNESPLSGPQIEELRAYWRQRIESRSERVILISGEGFFGNPYIGYSNTGAVANDLRKIFVDYPVQIIAVTRKQDRWTESAYQQYIKSGRTATFPDFLRDCGPFPLQWDALLDQWVAIFSETHVHAHLFETTFRDNVNPVEALFSQLGSPFRFVMRESQRQNPGLSSTGLEVLRRCNDLLTRQQSRQLRRWIEATMQGTGGYRYFTDTERLDFLQHCADSNRRLFRNYFPSADPSLYVPSETVVAANSG